jgi:hypothetical protein
MSIISPMCKILSEKQTKAKRAGGMAQVVEHLPSKCKALWKRGRKRWRRGGGENHWLGAVVCACKPSYWEAEAGGFRIPDQPGRHSENLFHTPKSSSAEA